MATPVMPTRVGSSPAPRPRHLMQQPMVAPGTRLAAAGFARAPSPVAGESPRGRPGMPGAVTLTSPQMSHRSCMSPVPQRSEGNLPAGPPQLQLSKVPTRSPSTSAPGQVDSSRTTSRRSTSSFEQGFVSGGTPTATTTTTPAGPTRTPSVGTRTTLTPGGATAPATPMGVGGWPGNVPVEIAVMTPQMLQQMHQQQQQHQQLMQSHQQHLQQQSLLQTQQQQQVMHSPQQSQSQQQQQAMHSPQQQSQPQPQPQPQQQQQQPHQQQQSVQHGRQLQAQSAFAGLRAALTPRLFSRTPRCSSRD
mmetsp:Transcript_47101/g.118616  ORF Transcript_47101/g.118616 Transcript_47101/m.118616 type:complete len:304 (+) Transcript_47101:60-971(+)